MVLVTIMNREGNLVGVYGNWPDRQGLARLLQENGWQPERPGDKVVKFTRETKDYGVLTAGIVHLRPIHDLETDLGISSTPPPVERGSSVVH